MKNLLRFIGLFLFVLWGMTVIVFLALHLAPGNPAQLLLGSFASAEAIAQLQRQLGLDQPLITQYGIWLGNMLHGDLGTSITLKEPVLHLLQTRLYNSALLAFPAFVLATAGGVGLGLASGMFKNTWFDHAVNTTMFTALAVPVFWLGLLLVIIFGLKLGWLPTSGMQAPGNTPTFSEVARHAVLPVLTLSMAPLAVIAQVTRGAVLDELKQDYVRTGIAKGLSRNTAILRHALRNTWIPVVTTLGLEMNYIIGGSVLVENVFNWPGVGQLLVQTAISRDYPVVLGASLILAALFVTVNFLVEASYALIDPRQRSLDA